MKTLWLLLGALAVLAPSVSGAWDAKESQEILDAARRLDQQSGTPEQHYIERMDRNAEIQQKLDELRDRIEDESPGTFDDDD